MSAAACLSALCIALGLAAVAAAVIRSAPAGRRRGDGDGDDDGGGSQPRTPPGRPPEPSGTTPDWWPGFEREFADYVRRRERTLSAD